MNPRWSSGPTEGGRGRTRVVSWQAVGERGQTGTLLGPFGHPVHKVLLGTGRFESRRRPAAVQSRKEVGAPTTDGIGTRRTLGARGRHSIPRPYPCGAPLLRDTSRKSRDTLPLLSEGVSVH